MHEHPDFILTRRFHAPRERVWRAWTEQARLQCWFTPAGLRMTHAALDLRVGGRFHYAMTAPDGQVTWGRWTIREVVPAHKLVMEIAFSDEHGGVARHPGAPDWPLRTLATVVFEDDGLGTRVTVHWSALDATAAEHAAFDSGHDAMHRGWSGTFGQLETYLREPE
jgi:uncharacterized protein YndB with AHSA1/START domain